MSSSAVASCICTTAENSSDCKDWPSIFEPPTRVTHTKFKSSSYFAMTASVSVSVFPVACISPSVDADEPTTMKPPSTAGVMRCSTSLPLPPNVAVFTRLPWVSNLASRPSCPPRLLPSKSNLVDCVAPTATKPPSSASVTLLNRSAFSPSTQPRHNSSPSAS